MKRIAALSLSIFTCLCLLLATERRAMAYVDPGQGLLFVQSIGAGLAATAYFLRARILALFGKGESARKKPSIGGPVPVAVQKGDSRKAA
jgi:hypothetical protein